MTDSLRVSRADRRQVENLTYVEVELTNGSASIVPPGGLRVRAGRSYGDPHAYLSASNHWPIAPGAVVFMTVILPTDSLKHIDFVEYIDANGTAHALGDRLSIGWLGCEFKRGAAGADV
ncbi:hypothetical protein [Methylobacterium brachythecii]|uniref:Uncharacterized protein n=1 Tax=Methylobacterium brachythecii TaxID=1176177 RepID=A0A7W6F569_9HYPH|nr:hypothetical protein [Methylobacterium brachythecii]MBB3901008.1 hypothetical protein [Methylobacterium brachythecii]GLS45309.1 hypothetical protein GCM10007884_32980 [Methylobacterium brachythecii]